MTEPDNDGHLQDEAEPQGLEAVGMGRVTATCISTVGISLSRNAELLSLLEPPWRTSGTLVA